MANETLTNIFSDIADAVRAKGVTGQMTPLQMPAKITSIPSGYSAVDLFNADLDLVFTGLTTIPNNPIGSNETGKFAYWNNIKSVSFPDLLSIGTWGCYKMFYGCTSLTSAPALPATTLANQCYANMFNGCTSLTTAPSLPATNLADNCYNNMFRDCTSLTTAPATLPATTLAIQCYYFMFYGCSSLTTAPELPATTLTRGCYQGMFNGCTSLTTAPSLPATNLADNCYNNMFKDCSSLTGTISVPVDNINTSIPTNSFSRMFQNCSNLTKVILDFSTFRSIPYLDSTNNVNVFNSTTDNRLEIRVPISLEADWKTASNWSTWASRIVGV